MTAIVRKLAKPKQIKCHQVMSFNYEYNRNEGRSESGPRLMTLRGYAVFDTRKIIVNAVREAWMDKLSFEGFRPRSIRRSTKHSCYSFNCKRCSDQHQLLIFIKLGLQDYCYGLSIS